MSPLVSELDILCEIIVSFGNIKANGYNLIGYVKTEGCEKFFDRFKGPIYLEPGFNIG